MGLLSKFAKKNKETNHYQKNYEEEHDSYDLSEEQDIQIDMHSKGTANVSREDKSIYYNQLSKQITDRDKQRIADIAGVAASPHDTYRRLEEADIPLEYLVALDLVEEIDIEAYQDAKAKGLDLKEMIKEEDLVSTDESLRFQTISTSEEMPELKNALTDEELQGEEAVENEQEKQDYESFDLKENDLNEVVSFTEEDESEEATEENTPYKDYAEKNTAETNLEVNSNLSNSTQEDEENPDFRENQLNKLTFGEEESQKDDDDFITKLTFGEDIDTEEDDEWDDGEDEEDEDNTVIEEVDHELNVEEETRGEDIESSEEDGEDMSEVVSAIKQLTNKFKRKKETPSETTEETEGEEVKGTNVINDLLFGTENEVVEEVDTEIPEEEKLEAFETTQQEVIYEDSPPKKQSVIEEKEEPRGVYVIAKEMLLPSMEGYHIEQVTLMNQINKFTSNRRNVLVITQGIPQELQKQFLAWLRGVEKGNKKYRIVTLNGSAVNHPLVETSIDLEKDSLDNYFKEYTDEKYKEEDIGSFLDISSLLE